MVLLTLFQKHNKSIDEFNVKSTIIYNLSVQVWINTEIINHKKIAKQDITMHWLLVQLVPCRTVCSQERTLQCLHMQSYSYLLRFHQNFLRQFEHTKQKLYYRCVIFLLLQSQMGFWLLALFPSGGEYFITGLCTVLFGIWVPMCTVRKELHMKSLS